MLPWTSWRPDAEADRTVSGPAVTVVLPTFRRPDALARALSSLAEQDDPGVEWELLVVDNDTAPGAASVVHALAPTIAASVTLLREPKRGAASARNTGIDAAKGGVVAFVDDDVVPACNWLSTLVAPVLAGDADAVGGKVELDPSVSLPGWLGSDHLGYLAHFDRGPEPAVLGPADYVLTANACFRADLLRAINGFDEALGPRPRLPMVNDDLDLCRRFAAGGGRMLYVPEAVVVHDLPASRITVRYLIRRAYAQGRSDWLLDRDVNVERPLGGAQGIVVHAGRLLADRLGEGLWRADVAMGAASTIAVAAGGLREAAAHKLGRLWTTTESPGHDRHRRGHRRRGAST